MNRPVRMAAVGVAAALVLSGCTYLTERNDAALEMTVLDYCSDVRPPDVPESDYVPPVDTPKMYAYATVTNDFTRTFDFSVRVDVFTLDGEKVGALSGYVGKVDVGESRTGLLTGDLRIAMPAEGIECRIRRVVVEGL